MIDVILWETCNKVELGNYRLRNNHLVLSACRHLSSRICLDFWIWLSKSNRWPTRWRHERKSSFNPTIGQKTPALFTFLRESGGTWWWKRKLTTTCVMHALPSFPESKCIAKCTNAMEKFLDWTSAKFLALVQNDCSHWICLEGNAKQRKWAILVVCCHHTTSILHKQSWRNIHRLPLVY